MRGVCGGKEEGFLGWKHARAKSLLGKKIVKKKERKIGREEGLQSKSSLFLLLFSYFSSFIMVVFLSSMSNLIF